MLNSNTLNWNQVRADFGDTNTAMNTAIGGFSKAGDVFTKMRDRLAAEEQQEWENQYKQDVFNESIRATNLADENADLDRDQAKLIAEWDKQVQDKANAINQQRVNLADQQYTDIRSDKALADQAVVDLTNGARMYSLVKEHEKEYNELSSKTVPLTKEEQEKLTNFTNERRAWESLKMPETILTASGRRQYLINRLGSLYPLISAPFETDYTNEIERGDKRTIRQQTLYDTARKDLGTHFTSAKFKPNAVGGALTAFDFLAEKYPNDVTQIADVIKTIDESTWHSIISGSLLNLEADDIMDEVAKKFENLGIKEEDLNQLRTIITGNSSKGSSNSSTDNDEPLFSYDHLKNYIYSNPSLAMSLAFFQNLLSKENETRDIPSLSGIKEVGDIEKLIQDNLPIAKKDKTNSTNFNSLFDFNFSTDTGLPASPEIALANTLVSNPLLAYLQLSKGNSNISSSPFWKNIKY